MPACRQCGANVDDQMASCPSCGLPKAVACAGCSRQYQVGPEHFRGGTRFEFKCPSCQTLVTATNPITQAPSPAAPVATAPSQSPVRQAVVAPSAQIPQIPVDASDNPTSKAGAPKKKLGIVPKVGIGLGIGCGGLIVALMLLGILGGLLSNLSGKDSRNGSAGPSKERDNEGLVAIFTMTVGNSQLVPLLAGIGESGEIKVSTDRGVVMYNRTALAQTIGGGRELRVPLSQEFTIQAYNGDSSGNFQLQLTIYDKSGNRKYNNVADSGEMLNVSQDDL